MLERTKVSWTCLRYFSTGSIRRWRVGYSRSWDLNKNNRSWIAAQVWLCIPSWAVRSPGSAWKKEQTSWLNQQSPTGFPSFKLLAQLLTTVLKTMFSVIISKSFPFPYTPPHPLGSCSTWSDLWIFWWLNRRYILIFIFIISRELWICLENCYGYCYLSWAVPYCRFSYSGRLLQLRKKEKAFYAKDLFDIIIICLYITAFLEPASKFPKKSENPAEVKSEVRKLHPCNV